MRDHLGIALAVVLCSTGASAQSQPASHATAKAGNIAILDTANLNWTTILSNKIKTSKQKDLFVSTSLECGLYTRTLSKSTVANARAGVHVRVLIDGREAYPGEVTFCEREQTLASKLGLGLEDCTDFNGDGVVTLDECTQFQQWVELILDTMNASTFNFILQDVGTGVHTVEVQAKIDSGASDGAPGINANATIGKGSMTVQEVRMIKGEDVEL